MDVVRVGEWLELDVPAGCPSTIESSKGLADVHRYFLGPVVVAATAEQVAGEARDLVERAAGSLLASYRSMPGYARWSRPSPAVPGADAAMHLEFTWQADHGGLMRSSAVIACDGTRLGIVHATVLDSLGGQGFAQADEVALSARLATVAQSPSESGDE